MKPAAILLLGMACATGLSAHAATGRMPDPRSQPAPDHPRLPITAAPDYRSRPPLVDTQEALAVDIDEPTLLARPDLLHRAMASAAQAGDTAGILILLPVYEQLVSPNIDLLDYGRALRARSQNRLAAAAHHYRQLLARMPEAQGIRMQLAETLVDNHQHIEAREQLRLLQANDIQAALAQRHAKLIQTLRKRDGWQVYAGGHFIDESNVNNAPAIRTVGSWTFDAPLRDQGLGYQAGTEKKWSLPRGFHYALDAHAYGKHYFHHRQYNDVTVHLAPGIGISNLNRTVQAHPFAEYRYFAGKAYSRKTGVKAQWNYWWSPRWQSLAAWEYGRQKHRTRTHLDHRGHLASLSFLFYPTDSQYWLFGHDIQVQTGTRDASDSFQQVGLRAGWGQVWTSGLGSHINAQINTRKHHGPTLFSNDARRRDTQYGLTLSIWHQRLSHGSVTPKLSVSHQRVRSNDVLFAHAKTRVFVEANTHF